MIGWMMTLALIGAPTRYALLVGANQGAPDEVLLQHAVDDARRMEGVLTSVGDFAPENVVVLEQPQADQFRSALAMLNARLRASEGGMLLVYYSGHADALSLHLGRSALPWDDLKNQVIGSSAATRVLIVDACRSGSLTKVKGTKVVPPFALADEAKMPQGVVLLSSASATEEAQESSALGGSFFTHHLSAGLRGAADLNQDGRVTLTEAYRYATDRTVVSTARTLAGVQHPTYSYEFKGRADLVLTKPGAAKTQARLLIEQPGHYLLYRGGERGPLVTELVVEAQQRLIAVPQGRYFLQRRTPDRYWEGTMELALGAAPQKLSTRGFKEIEYAQLVRKGGARKRVFQMSASAVAQSAPLQDVTFMSGAALSFGLVLRQLTLETSLQGVSSVITDARRLSSFSAQLGARRAFDWGPMSASLGLRAGVLHLVYAGEASSLGDHQTTGVLDNLVRFDFGLSAGLFLTMELALRLAWIRVTRVLGRFDTAPNESPVQVRPMASLRFGLGWML